ncbi:Conserved_hypothetical protein [Hexamita inflata]|uniref:Uncharacterized protein n=1 Tax=Hexamita inflata TaxID=28002 RepID=A0AA86P3W2_9EUKA|nr:Conserved hypothetical protein [Hexamita inflata]
MLPNDSQKRKEFENFIKDLDEDDVSQLPPINEQLIRQLIRKLQQGENIEMFQEMKIGAYKKDICQAIMLHQYASQEDVFALLTKLAGCAHDFAKVLCKNVEEQLVTLSDFFLHSTEEKSNIIELREKHITFILNMKNVGFDEKSKLIYAAALSLVQEIIALAKAVELVSQNGISLKVLEESFKFSLIEYFKSFERMFLQTNEALFGLDVNETPFVGEISKEEFTSLILTDKECKLQSPKREGQLFIKAYFAQLKQVFTTVFRSFNSLNMTVTSSSKNMRRANEAEKKLMKDLVKYSSFIMQSLNNMFDTFGYPKTLKNNPVLTDVEELELATLMDSTKTSINRYHVYSFKDQALKKSVDLCSANSCQIELEFNYPKDFFKHNIEELTVLKIKSFIDVLDKVNLIKHFETLFSKCQSYDDIEYLAYSLYNQANDTEEMKYEISRCLGKPWIIYSNMRFVAHFIATFYYNGIELYYLPKYVSFDDFQDMELNDFCLDMLKENIQQKEIIQMSILVRELLYYRLISTQHVFDLTSSLLKSIQNQKITEKTFQNDSSLHFKVQYFTSLIYSCYEYLCLFDEKYSELIQISYDRTFQVIKQWNPLVDTQREFLQSCKIQLDQVITVVQQENVKVMAKRAELQKLLEENEKKRKFEQYMMRLKENNPKLYRKEYEKVKRREEKEAQELREQEQKEIERAAKNKKTELKQITEVTQMIEEFLLQKIEAVQLLLDFSELSKTIVAQEKARADADQLQGEDVRMKLKKFDEAKVKLRNFMKFLEAVQNLTTFSNYKLIAEIFTAINNDWLLSKMFKDVNYVVKVGQSENIDHRTLLMKLALFICKLITPEQLQTTATSVIKSIQFIEQFATDASQSDIQQQIIREKKITCADKDLVVKTQFLLMAGLELNEKQIMGLALICYASENNDQYLCTTEFQQVEQKENVEELIKNVNVSELNVKKVEVKSKEVVSEEEDLEALFAVQTKVQKKNSQVSVKKTQDNSDL